MPPGYAFKSGSMGLGWYRDAVSSFQVQNQQYPPNPPPTNPSQQYPPRQYPNPPPTVVGNPEFVPAQSVEGMPRGYAFKQGPSGLGWYRDASFTEAHASTSFRAATPHTTAAPRLQLALAAQRSRGAVPPTPTQHQAQQLGLRMAMPSAPPADNVKLADGDGGYDAYNASPSVLRQTAAYELPPGQQRQPDISTQMGALGLKSPPPRTAPPVMNARVLQRYDAQSAREVSLMKGEYVSILSRDPSSGWCKVRTEDGRQGWAPASWFESL